jgi:hypothetical protein
MFLGDLSHSSRWAEPHAIPPIAVHPSLPPPMPSDPIELNFDSHLFATLFLGTASGQFLRPAASRLLLSRVRP